MPRPHSNNFVQDYYFEQVDAFGIYIAREKTAYKMEDKDIVKVDADKQNFTMLPHRSIPLRSIQSSEPRRISMWPNLSLDILLGTLTVQNLPIGMKSKRTSLGKKCPLKSG